MKKITEFEVVPLTEVLGKVLLPGQGLPPGEANAFPGLLIKSLKKSHQPHRTKTKLKKRYH